MCKEGSGPVSAAEACLVSINYKYFITKAVLQTKMTTLFALSNQNNRQICKSGYNNWQWVPKLYLWFAWEWRLWFQSFINVLLGSHPTELQWQVTEPPQPFPTQSVQCLLSTYQHKYKDLSPSTAQHKHSLKLCLNKYNCLWNRNQSDSAWFMSGLNFILIQSVSFWCLAWASIWFNVFVSGHI